MVYSSLFALSTLLALASAMPVELAKRQNTNGVDVNRIPQFDVTPGIKDPAGSANCIGANGAFIPCSCPPDRQTFINQMIANVGAGHAVNNPGVGVPAFPAGNSENEILTIFTISTVTLQNLNGPGVGCPQVATTWASQIAAVKAGGPAPFGAPAAAPAPAPAPAPVAAAAPPPSSGINLSLVPQFGIQAGIKDPAGSANCIGVNGAFIPCSCPPDRQTFLNQLQANVAAGHAVNNPAVSVPAFPSGTSLPEEQAIFFISTVTLQNLNGPGVGCPQVATTWAQQLAALH